MRVRNLSAGRVGRHLLSKERLVSSVAAIQRHDTVGEFLVLVNLEHLAVGKPGNNVIVSMKLGVIEHVVQAKRESFWQRARIRNSRRGHLVMIPGR